MVCLRCGAKNPGRAASCGYCGQSLSSQRDEDSELGFDRASLQENKELPNPEQRTVASQRRRLNRGTEQQTQSSFPPKKTANRTGKPLEEEEDIFRDLFAKVVEINRRIKEQKRDIDVEALSGLYTARSFATPEAMGRTTGAIRHLLQTNQRLAGELDRALEGIKARVETANWNRADKLRFWSKIADGFLNRFRLRPELLAKQEQWTRETVDLYEFVLAHSDELSFKGKLVQASDCETGEEFVRRLRRAKRCRDAFRSAAGRISELRASSF